MYPYVRSNPNDVFSSLFSYVRSNTDFFEFSESLSVFPVGVTSWSLFSIFLWDRGPDWPKNFLRGSFDFEFAFEFKSLFGPKRFDYWLFFFLFAYNLLSIFWDVIELNPLPILKLFLYQNSTTTIPLRLLVSSFRTRDSRKKPNVAILTGLSQSFRITKRILPAKSH